MAGPPARAAHRAARVPAAAGPGLRGSKAITSATSQEGPHVATAYAETENEGDLLPFATGRWDTDAGTPDPDPDDMLLQVVRTGSLYDSAEWAWKLDGHGHDRWVGMDDLRWQHRPEDTTGQVYALAGAPAIVHSEVHQRTIVAWQPGGAIIRTRRRALGSSTWTDLDITVGTGRQPLALGAMEIVELPDGSLRLFYLYTAPAAGATDNDLDVWGSQDGGETWELVKERVITDVLGAPANVRDVKVARSGDWLRMELYRDTVPTGLVSACSSDRCATWQVVRDTPDGTDALSADTTRAWVYDLAAVDQQGTHGPARAAHVGQRAGLRAGHARQRLGEHPADHHRRLLGAQRQRAGSGAQLELGAPYVLVLYDDAASLAGVSAAGHPDRSDRRGLGPERQPTRRLGTLGLHRLAGMAGGQRLHTEGRPPVLGRRSPAAAHPAA